MPSTMNRFSIVNAAFLLIINVIICWMISTAQAEAEFRPSRLQISRTSFTSYLVMVPSVDTQSVSLSCQASVVDDITVADDALVTPDCSFTSAVTAPSVTTPPDPNSPWEVVNSRFDIPENLVDGSRSYVAVTTERVFQPIARRVEIVVTTCCVLDSSLNNNYRGDAAVAVAAATIQPYYCANCSNTLTNPTAERTIQNPGFVEVAQCPCNLRQDACDFNCDCDTECTASDKARFGSTIPGLLGGQEAGAEEYKCKTKAFNPPDWHLLTCVYWENNAFLGLYFKNRDKLTSSDAITAARNTYTNKKFSLAETESRNVNRDYAAQYYRLGLIVQTRQVAAPNLAGSLSLPQSISGSACNPLAPVQFLVPLESSCTSQLTSQTCSAISTFSTSAYAMSDNIATNFQIMSNFTEGNAIASEVRYHCLTDYSAYQPVTTTPLGGQSSTIVSNFPNTLLTEDCSSSCDNPTCWQYNTDRSYPESTPLPPLCTTQPPEPSFDSTTGVCSNAVLDVRYSFEWSGPEIRRLVASVIVADVTGVNVGVTLAQKFSVQWQHILNVTNPPLSDNFLNSSTAYSRSGSVGYEPGKPLFSGCADRNSTTGVFNEVDSRVEKQIATWRPGVDGLCANARRQFLSFGDDTVSSCALRLDFNELNNSCVELRQLITNHLNVLMAGDVIGRYGYNDANNEAMWIPVLRQNLSAIEVPSPSPISFNASDNVTIFRLTDEIAGICFVPSAINLNILYAQTGAVFRHPRYEVVGAYVNYTHSNWSMECMGANSERCNAASGLVQNFFLYSSVRFIQIPPVPPTPDSKFHTRFDPQTCTSDTCYRYLENFATDECYYDICWREIAYPLTSHYEGDSHKYALAVFLLLVLGIVGYASVSRPGWS